MNQHIDKVHYGYPDYRFSHLVFYVVRKAWHTLGPIKPGEWISHVKDAPDLVLDEIYPQYNINRECQETWREVGRAIWLTPDGDIHFHFRPAGVGYVGMHMMVNLKTGMQRERLLKALPENPVLEDWLSIVKKSRYMELVEDQDEPRKAWWLGRKGQKKILFTWQPPAVWMYQMAVSGFFDDPPQTDPARKDRCEQLAGDLDARVEIEP